MAGHIPTPTALFYYHIGEVHEFHLLVTPFTGHQDLLLFLYFDFGVASSAGSMMATFFVDDRGWAVRAFHVLLIMEVWL
jgi:hypothetical protein